MRNRKLTCRTALLSTLCLGALVGAADGQQPAQGIVFVANGSGDFRTLSRTLTQAVAEERLPLAVEPVLWSHGHGRYILDHINHCHHIEMGRRLAVQVAAYRRHYPWLRIYLVGHSAGTAVVLAAAEHLPPGTVDRILLLSPSVSPDYDLRLALACAREGIDAFVSEHDRVILGLAMRVVGTADRKWGPAAGQVGFRPVVATATDSTMYCRLRVRHWHPSQNWTGHYGGHYGNSRVNFLRAAVLPLLAPRN
ncbi:MAG: hypothetical protein L0Z62_03765 [Gemmataceae bacterium]|nr:hypothetical protein [Gemmataceae bacterium]